MARMPRLFSFSTPFSATRLGALVALVLTTLAGAADLTLTWTDNSDNETGFKIERSSDGSAFSQITTVGANVATYTDTGLTPGDTYWYKVKATNAAGDSGYTNVASGVPADDPPPPPPSNTNPVVSDIPDQVVPEDGSTGPIAFTVSDAETPAGNLTLSAASSNPTLLPVGAIVFGGSGGNRTVTVTPAANQSGSATLTVTVSDGALTDSDTFLVTVTPAPVPATFDYTRPSGGTIALTSQNIGTVGDSGSTAYHSGSGVITLTAGGTDIWNEADGFRFVAHQVTGDFSVVARIDSLTLPHQFAKAGVMIRESLEANSIHALANLNPSGSANFVYRTVTGGASNASSLSATAPSWVRLERVGNAITAFHSTDGSTWAQIGEQAIAFPSTVYVGLAATAHTTSDTITAAFSDYDLAPIDPPPANTAPTISNITNISTNEDTATGAIAFTVSDAQTAAESLTISSTSSNTTLVPNATIVFGGSGGNRTVTVTPAANQSGSATLTVTVSDGSLSASDSFVLTVNAVNDAPTISNITNKSTNEDTPTGSISFTVSDVETAAGSLAVSGSSSNTTLVPLSGIVFGGSGGNRTVTITPAANQSGSATITVTVSDGSLSASDLFTLTVNAVNDAPTISNITNKTTAESTPTSAIAFTVSDVETAAGSLTVSGSSSNTALVPNSSIIFSGSGGNRALVVTPSSGQFGTATLTITVSDGNLSASDTFLLTVTGVNDAPTISNITNRTVDEDTATAAIGFSISDAETAAGSLTVSGSSSNTTLVPNNSIVFGGSNGNRTVTVTPAANQSGTATITVTVDDGSLSASNTFNLTVTEVNDAPTISNVTNRTIGEGATTGAIGFTVSDIESSSGSLTLSADSSNLSLVPVSAIVFGGSGGNRTVTVTPTVGQSGNATITLTVSDGGLSASDAFVLTVTATPDPVTVSVVSPTEGQTFTLGETIRGEALTSDIARTATVEFFHDATQINTERLSPYNFNWTPSAAGTYAIKAIVTDTDGASTESAPISITLIEPTPDPLTVTLTGPEDGSDHAFGDPITVTATVSDPARTDRVELLVDGDTIGQDTTSPYVLLWSGGTSGDHTLQVRAVDTDGGSVLSEAVTVSIGNPPLTVTLTNPVGDRELEAGQSLLLEAVPSEIGNTSKIEFLVDGAIVNTQLQTPYDYNWSSTEVGAHTIQAKAYDASGASTLSASVTITITEPITEPTIVLTQPVAFSTFEVESSITLESEVDAEGVSVSRVEYHVNGVKIGQANAAPYQVAWVGLEAGEYTIVARAIVPGGTDFESAPRVVTIEEGDSSAPLASGVYRGKFKKVKVGADQGDGTAMAGAESDESGSFAIFVDDEGRLTFVGYDAQSGTGFLEVGLSVDPDGSFEVPGSVAASKDSSIAPLVPPAAIQARIHSKGVSGQIGGTDILIEGGFITSTGTTSAFKGFYELNAVRADGASVAVIVGADGVAVALARNNGSVGGQEIVLQLVDEGAYLSSAELGLELVFDSVKGGVEGLLSDADGNVMSLMGLRSDVAPERRLENISTRGTVSTGSGVMISGFVVSGDAPKTVLIRAIGPGLGQFGVTTFMRDPVLELVGDSGVITANARWMLGNFGSIIETVSARIGAFALDPDSLDAVLLVTVAPGRYSAVVRDAAGRGGDSLIEIYDATDTVVAGNDLVNLSTRGAVGSGKNLIGGFVVTGNVPKRVLIRGVGPGLGGFGVVNALPAAKLVLTQRVDGKNERVAENAGWSTNPNPEAIQAASENAGAFLLSSGSGDCALLLWLEPGIYTAEVQPGTPGASGVGLVEVYQTD